MQVETAQREKLKIPIMLSGASGSGKTTSALLLAYGIVSKMFPDLEGNELWEKIGVIDTEGRRSLFLVGREFNGLDIGNFKLLDLDQYNNFSADMYEQAFDLLIDQGCEVVIIDSVSHNWEGNGGMIQAVDKLGGKFSDWGKVKPQEVKFQKLLKSNKAFVISTARVKQDYAMETNEKGKVVPRKIGLRIIQKDSLEYELGISIRIDQGAIAYPMKDNTGIFDTPKIIEVEDGEKIFEWANNGVDVLKLKDELITKISESVSLSDNHEKQYQHLAKKMNRPLKELPMSTLETIKEAMDRVPMPEEGSKDNKVEEQDKQE